MLEIFTALTGDYLNANGIVLSGTVAAAGGCALQRLLKARTERARDIFIDELKRGSKTLHEIEEDDAAAITYRYFRAAQEGAARLNLRLLAAIVGGSEEKQGTYADEFLRWSDIIASMAREELIICGVAYRQSGGKKAKHSGNFWNNCIIDLSSNHEINEDDSNEIAASIVRTGLLSYDTTWNGPAYQPSARLLRLGKMVDLKQSFGREGITL